jgi:hypothetical protein
MKWQKLSAVGCVLSLCLAMTAGRLHDHHDADDQDHEAQCAACAVLLNGATDAPAVEVVVSAVVEQTAFVLPERLVFEPVLMPFAASRAPPVCPA